MIEISDDELKSLTTAIKSRFDIDFTNYEPKSLKRGFARLVVKHRLNDLMGLWSKILHDRGFFMAAVDDLTVNLTELFRNPELWAFMRDNILDSFQSKVRLRITHAGCSSGEEIYSMAMVLNDTRFLYKTKAYAYDLSHSVLEKAKAGIYPQNLWKKYGKSFKEYFPNKDVTDFFNEEEGALVVKPELKKHVLFKQLNLVSDPLDSNIDIFFIRNVLIYFDEALKMKVLRKIHESLNQDGFLILGYYDVLPGEANELFQAFDNKTRVYVKRT